MSVLRGLRELILGETWTLPIGVALVLAASGVLRAAAPALWRDVGGLALLVGVVAVLVVSVRAGARGTP